MKVLALGPPSPLFEWLETQADVTYETQPLRDGLIRWGKFDWLVSYGYRYILKKDILDLFPDRAVNVHISYLPWNRGADPNLWSWLDDTPKGVTIHHMDEGIDTGDIIFQVAVDFSGGDPTLAESYETLKRVATQAFKVAWGTLVDGTAERHPQVGKGSFHRASDMAYWRYLFIPLKWDTPCSEIREGREVER